MQKQRSSLLLKLLWRGKRTGHEYRAIWISQQELQDEGIILSGRMMAGVCLCGCRAAAQGVWSWVSVGHGVDGLFPGQRNSQPLSIDH